MPTTAGFDLCPPLEDTELEKAKWARVLARVKQHFVFFPTNKVIPKEDHILFKFSDTSVKLPKDGTRFRSLVVYCPNDAFWYLTPVIAIIWGYALQEFGMDRARYYSSFLAPNSLTHGYHPGQEDGGRSVYSAEEIAEHLTGVNSSIDVSWDVYGGEPDTNMWDELADEAYNAWHSTSADGEQKSKLQAKEYHARRMRAFGKAWPVIKQLRLCHRHGDGGTGSICKLPAELLTEIEETLMMCEGAPLSLASMAQSYEEEET